MLSLTLIFTNPDENVSALSERLQQHHRDAIERAIATFLETNVPVRVDAFSYETGVVLVAFIGNRQIGTASFTRAAFIQQARRVQFCVPVLWELEGGLCMRNAPEPFTTAGTNTPELTAAPSTPEEADVSAGVSEDSALGVTMSGTFTVAVATVAVIICFGIGYAMVKSKSKEANMRSAATVQNPAADFHAMQIEAMQNPHRMSTDVAMLSLGLTPARSLSGVPSMEFPGAGVETSGI